MDGIHDILQGISNTKVNEISSSQFKSLHNSKALSRYFHLALSYAPNIQLPHPDGIPSALKNLLQQFDNIFHEPQERPPHRSTTHQIQYVPNSAPVNVRPHRNPFFF